MRVAWAHYTHPLVPLDARATLTEPVRQEVAENGGPQESHGAPRTAVASRAGFPPKSYLAGQTVRGRVPVPGASGLMTPSAVPGAAAFV